MGFPSTEALLPKFLMNTLSILGFIRALTLTIFRLLGLPHFLEPEESWPEPSLCTSVSASLIRDLLPVSKFGDVPVSDSDTSDTCVVCLYEFQWHEEIRRLRNCQHIFHKGCVDRWMDHDQRTCPLCRAPLVPDDMADDFNEKLLRACPSTMPDFGGDFTPLNTFL